MGATAAEFLITIEQQLQGDDAASELEKAEQAVKDSIASYRQLEAATGKTQAQLEKVTTAMAGVRDKMKAAMDAGNPAGFWKQASALEKLEQKEKELKTAVADATKALEAQKKAVTGAAGNLDTQRKAAAKGGLAARVASAEVFDLNSSFTALGGPLGGTIGKLLEFGEASKKLTMAHGRMGLFMAGSVLAVAAVALLAAAFLGLAAAALKAGLAQADAVRTQRLNLQAMLQSKDAAGQMQAEFRSIGKTTGATNDRLFELTKKLKEAKISGQAMKTSLRAIATQEAAIGQDGTDALIQKLQSGQTSADKLATDIEKKYGGVVAEKMTGLGASFERLKGNFGALSSGLDIGPLMAAFSKFVDMFDETTSSGQTMKALFEGVFQPMVNAIAVAFPYAQLFIVKFINTLLKIAVAVQPAYNKVKELFGLGEEGSAMSTVLEAAELAAIAFAAAIGIAVLAIGAFVLWVVNTARGFATLWQAAKAAWDGVVQAFDKAKKAIGEVDLTQLGKDIIDGLVKGIKAGAGAVKDAVVGVVDGAIEAGKEVLGIKSPSKVFAELGWYSAKGFSVGIEDGQPDVEGAVTSMLGTPEAEAGTGSRSRGPVTVHVNLTISGVSGAEGIIPAIESAVSRIFEDAAAELGAGYEEGYA